MNNIIQELENYWQGFSKEPNNMGKNNTMRKASARLLCQMMGYDVDFSDISGDYVTKGDVFYRLNDQNRIGLQEYIAESLKPNSSVRVVNAEGTGEDHPDNETSWREYWENRTEKDLDELLPNRNGKYQCPCHAHHEEGDDGYVEMKDICGCHMQMVTKEGKLISKKMYIAPMCRGCNKRTDIFVLPKKFLIELH